MVNGLGLARSRAMGRLIVTLSIVMGITACGGNEGDGGSNQLSAPTTAVTLGTSNGQTVAAAAFAAASGSIGSSQVTVLGVQGQVDTAPATHVMERVTSHALLRLVASTNSPASATGAVQSTLCDVSGSETVSASSATSFSVTFNQCSDVAGVVLNGSMSVADFVYTGDQYSGSLSASVSMDVSVTESGVTTRVVGGYQVVMSWTSDTWSVEMTGARFGYTNGVTTEILSNFDISETENWSTYIVTSSAGFTLASTKLGGAVTVDTLTPFEASLYNQYPYKGSLLVTGAAGTSLQLTVLGDETDPPPQVQIDLDANGDGLIDLTTQLSWSTLVSH